MATSCSEAAAVKKANARATNNKQYTFLSLLGKGSFGTVLEARDESDGGELVAIKIVKAQRSFLNKILRRTPKEITEAHQEVDILLQLKHPNVLLLKTYYEFKTKNKHGLAMVTEYCSNGSLQMHLSDLSRKGERPDKEQSLQWYQELSNGLRFIHSRGIIHRDLKPDNVLITGNFTLKIADVGLARVVWDLKSRCNEIPAGSTFDQYMRTIAGTKFYMAPEMFQGHYRISSDIFSLGLIFVMIAEVPNPVLPKGKLPLTMVIEGNLGEVMHNSMCRKVEPTSLLVPPIRYSDSDEIELFNRMLQYDHHKRPNIDGIIKTLAEIKEKRKPVPVTATETSYCIIL